jgi:hypothetical protein
MNRSFTHRQLDRRANTLLRQARNVPSGSEIIRELAEISIKIEDAPVKPDVAARLTVSRENGRRTIVEVYSNATFHSFYFFYSQKGNRRSTKKLTRVAGRNEGSPLVGVIRQPSGLDTIAKKLEMYQNQSNPITSSKLRIYKRRAYRHLLSVSPDQIWRRS